MTDRPCKDGRHTFTILHSLGDIKCENCPIVITAIELQLVEDKNALIELVKEKEHEWYTRELES